MDVINRPEFTIGEVAKSLGIVVPLIRSLEKAGLILSARTEHGKRLYSQCDLDYIDSILKVARENDYSLEEMNRFIGSARCWEIIDCAPEQRGKCPHYKSITKPCWVDRNCPLDELEVKCRECEVYLTLAENLLELARQNNIKQKQ